MLYFLRLDSSLVLSTIVAACVLMTFVALIPYVYIRSNENGALLVSYAEGQTVGGMMNQTDTPDMRSTENKLASSNNQIHGTLIVTKDITNQSGGNNKNPSDFTITVHGNNPSPSSFPGSSSGTDIKLQMGMYSVTETGPSGYNSTLTGDCSGGMMSVETKKCSITNTNSNKPAIGNNNTK
jgi:prealbumin domain-containing protein